MTPVIPTVELLVSRWCLSIDLPECVTNRPCFQLICKNGFRFGGSYDNGSVRPTAISTSALSGYGGWLGDAWSGDGPKEHF